MIPTLFGITLLTFVIINLAPGSPIEQKLQAIRFGSSLGGGGGGTSHETGVNAEVVEALKKQYGFDKPMHMRYLIWLKNISRLDFGNSFTYEEPVMDVITSKFPVSLQFGVTSIILTYLICIPLGMHMAVRAGSKMDRGVGFALNMTYSLPPLILGIFLVTILASKWDLFPLGGFRSDDWAEMSNWDAFKDRVHHFILPLIRYMIGGFTQLSYLMRNSMLEVTKSDYVRTARAKGLKESVVLYKHALRNALIALVPGVAGFFAVFLTGSIVIEKLFNLDGIGLLGYQAVLSRDYNVIMGLTFISSLILLLGRVVSDVLYILIDPRIDFQ
jgi:microcin C transport system permease protein